MRARKAIATRSGSGTGGIQVERRLPRSARWMTGAKRLCGSAGPRYKPMSHLRSNSAAICSVGRGADYTGRSASPDLQATQVQRRPSAEHRKAYEVQLNRTVQAMAQTFAVITIGALALSLPLFPAPALAEPPPHAKAHGWRKKNDPTYPGYTGRVWTADYGIVSAGRCNTDAVLAAVGGAVGGVIGAQVGSGGSDGERAIAIVVGTALGAVIGNRVGRELDRTDQGCIGHALELGGAGRPVLWTNPGTRVTYNLVPLKSDGSSCRNFKLDASREGKAESTQRRACRTGDGVWQLQ